jgi:hypothetical protein
MRRIHSCGRWGLVRLGTAVRRLVRVKGALTKIGPRIARIRNQPIQWPVFDLKAQVVIDSLRIILLVHFPTPIFHLLMP